MVSRAQPNGMEIPIPIKDPRLMVASYHLGPKTGKKRLRKAPYEIHWPYDENSVGPGPPTQILISGLSQLQTLHDIAMYFRPYGEIEDLDLKVDPASGAS